MKKIIVLLSAATILVSCSFLPIKKSKELIYETNVLYRTMVCCDVVMTRRNAEGMKESKIFDDPALWNATDSIKIIIMNVSDWEDGRPY